MIILIKNEEPPIRSNLNKFTNVVAQDLLKIFALLFGFLFTYVVIYAINGDKTLVIIFKGISIQVLFNTFFTLNFSEMTLWFYFLLLFFVILGLNSYIRQRFADLDENALIKQFKEFLKLFSEGSLVLPLFLMVGFPFIVQTLLPTIIYGVLFIEMLVPFLITGRLFKTSTKNFKIFISKFSIKLKSIKFLILSLLYPIFIFLMIWSNLDVFYSLVHYNLLWDNPSSQIATSLWGFLNDVVTAFEFGNASIHDFIYHSIIYINALIILSIFSIIYLICEKIITDLIGYILREKLMPYN